MADDGRRHAAVVVSVGGVTEEIDELIAPLIRAAWQAGIRTMMSCQETEPGMAWIEFDSPEDLVRFLNVVAVYEPGVDTLYNRAAWPPSRAASAAGWDYQLTPLDCAAPPARRGRRGDFILTAGVRIPHADLPAVRRRLERHARGESRQGG